MRHPPSPQSKLAFVLALIISSPLTLAQTEWEPVGLPGSASLGPSLSGNLKVHPQTGKVIVLHQNMAANPVSSEGMIFDPSSPSQTEWQRIAPTKPAPFSFGPFWYSRADFDAQGNLWVFGRDYRQASGMPGDGTITKYNVTTGQTTTFDDAATTSAAHGVSIAVSKTSDLIVVAFEDESGNPTSGSAQYDANQDVLTVKAFDEPTETFVPLGDTSGFGYVLQTSAAFDSTGNLFVGYVSYPHRGANVITFDPVTSTWSHVGVPNLSGSAPISSLRIGIAPDDTLWAFYLESIGIAAMRYNPAQQTWERAQGPGLGNTAAGPHAAYLSGQSWRYWLGMAFEPTTSAPTLAFNLSPFRNPVAPFTHQQIVVTRLEGNNWVTLGGAVSSGIGHHPEIAYAPDGSLFVGYKDLDSGSRTTVKRLAPLPTATVGAGRTSITGAAAPLLSTNGLTPTSGVGGGFYLSLQTPMSGAYMTVYAMVNQELRTELSSLFSSDVILAGNPGLATPMVTLLTNSVGQATAAFVLPPFLSGVEFTVQAAGGFPGHYAVTNGLIGTIR